MVAMDGVVMIVVVVDDMMDAGAAATRAEDGVGAARPMQRGEVQVS